MLSAKKILLYILIPAAAILVIVGGITWLVMYLTSKDASLEINALDPSRKKLVIDHDGGADDAVAISMSLLYEKYFEGPYVVALTTTHGNVNQSQVEVNSARILNLCGRENVPIYSGAVEPIIDGIESDYYFGHDGLGDDGYVHSGTVKVQEVHAAIGLIQLSKKYEGELIVLAIGPLTNIALAIRLDPNFIDRLSHLYVGAGNINSTKTYEPEFNAAIDPEAYYIMAEKAKLGKVTIVPFTQIQLNMGSSLEWRVNVLGNIQTPIMQALNGYERLSLAASTSWEILDPAVAAIVLDPEIVTEYRNSNNSIILCGADRAINTNDFSSSNPNVRVFYSGDVERYRQLLLDIFSAELKYTGSS